MRSDFDKITKLILDNKKELLSLQKEHTDIKKTLKKIDQKISNVLDKIQEFEIVLDAAEALEGRLDEEEDEKYNTEWNPDEDEDFNTEDYDDDGEKYL
jgi:peptidoglycan hydrolase CwlO-like protein|tara:strand:- start:52 stop:345 length:294 start_codon:yes stop_codon:yes gene_type:complete